MTSTKAYPANAAQSTAGDEPLSLEVTRYCDSRCLHCFVRAGAGEPASLPLPLAREALSEGYREGYRHLHLTGGEPLRWEGLFPVLEHAFSLGYTKAFVNTNGKSLSRERCSRLAAYAGLSLSVSLEGPEVLHDRIRGGGSFRQALAGVERALAADLEVAAFTTARRTLLPALPRFASDLHRTFPDLHHLTLIQLIAPRRGAFALADELLPPEDYVRLVETASFLCLAEIPVRLKNSPLAALVARLLGLPWSQNNVPLHRNGYLILLADGRIAPAHSSRPTFGTYAPGRLREVLDAPAYRAAVGPDALACPCCPHVDLCRESGMVRPPESLLHPGVEGPYCRHVLDGLARASPRAERCVSPASPDAVRPNPSSHGGRLP